MKSLQRLSINSSIGRPLIVYFFGLNLSPRRKLKPDARLPEEPENPNRLVSAADCRFMAFESTSEATKLWIKGREFSVARLLGEEFKGEAERYNGGALAIFRLAPQDYHRFHSPVDGTIGRMSYISGEYYTVNVSAFPALGVYISTSFDRHYSRKPSGLRWMYTAKMQGRSSPSIVLNSGASWLLVSGL
jgi:phosphatidylserine decarboxylase